MALASSNLQSEGGLCAAAMQGSVNLLNDDFSAGNGESAWPSTVGYAGDFNGDWYTDTGAALVYNPNWSGQGAGVLPTMTGFVKFLRVWPAEGATISVSAEVRTELTTTDSDTTVVLYFLDAADAMLGYQTSSTLGGESSMTLRIDGAAIPAGTVRIAVVPTAYITAAEQGTVIYESLRADYSAPGDVTLTSLYSDALATAGDPLYDALHPTGWTEYGGDYRVHQEQPYVTLWNPSWSGGALPSLAVLSRTVDISGVPAGSVLRASVFASSTYSSAESWSDLAVTFDEDSTALSSGRLTGENYVTLKLTDIPVPAGAQFAHFHIRTNLAADETSSLYLEDFAVSLVSGNLAPVPAEDSDADGIATVCDNCPTVANASQTDVNGDGHGDDCVSPGAAIEPQVTIGRGAVIGSGVVIKKGAYIGSNVVIGRNTVIQEYARIDDNSVLGESITIKQYASVGKSVLIGNSSVVEESATVGDGSIIGSSVTIKEDAVLGAGVSVGDKSVIESDVQLGAGVQVGQLVTIKEGAVLGEAVTVGNNSVIERNVTIGRDSKLGRQVLIKARARLGVNVTVRDSKVVNTGAVVPDGATI